jgi:hypothetical protein
MARLLRKHGRSDLAESALIVGAAMLMRVETSFCVLGYPGLAMLCFLVAGGGFAPVIHILRHDRRSRRDRER